MDSLDGGDYLMTRAEYIFDHSEGSFPWRSFTLDSLVAQFLSDSYFMSANISIHGGVITLTWRSKISSVPVNYFPRFTKVYLAVMHIRRSGFHISYQTVINIGFNV